MNRLEVGARYEKSCKFKQTDTKENVRNGVPVGIIEGLASTYEQDRGDDIIVPGAFASTLNRHAAEGRPVRMLLQHQNGELIGGFPIEYAKETPDGLFVRGEINLEVQRGREAYALAKQDVLTDMSIGFSIPSRDSVDYVREGDRVIRMIKEVELWEISLVSEPMNPGAKVVSVKSATPFADLPVCDRSRSWDSAAAIQRVRSATGSEEAPSDKYADAFLWYDPEESDSFGAYKLPVADVVEGELCVVPRAVFSAAAAMLGARGGVDIPEADRDEVIANIERYYQKLGLESPFNREKGLDSTLCEACESLRDAEELLRALGLSSEGRKILISRIKSSSTRDELGEDSEVLTDREDPQDGERISKALEAIDNRLLGIRLTSALNRLT